MTTLPALPTAIYRDFAGRCRKFELRLGEIGELERICNAGIAAILTRLSYMQWRYDDIRETIRLGLMGGGASESDATMLALHYLDPRPKGEYLQLAADILSACIAGAEPGKDQGGEREQRRPGDLSPFYEVGGAIGFSPRDVDRMTLADSRRWPRVLRALMARRTKASPASKNISRRWRCSKRWERLEPPV